MRVHVLTIFPEFFATPLATGVPRRAREAGLLDVSLIDVREYTHDRHRSTDDYPYGGGSGMVMRPEPLVEALEAITIAVPKTHKVLLSPRGRLLDHAGVVALSGMSDLVLVCGRYEGIDERVRHFVDDEISIGDYVLSGGEIAALTIIDAVARLLPGVLGNAASAAAESFASGLLEYPQYTRPPTFRGHEVPAVLLSGDHAEIARWREDAAREVTRRMRPALLAGYDGTAQRGRGGSSGAAGAE